MFVLLFVSSCLHGQTISLEGEWEIALDSTSIGHVKGWNNCSFKQSIHLPGTTDDAGLGVPNSLEPMLQKPQLSHLTRKKSYIGEAWYTKDIVIPVSWKKKQISFEMERVLWKTNVWVDGKEVAASCNSLIAPHTYNLTDYLTPGTHRITVLVDNRKQFEDISVDNMAHAYTDHTQIIWNGILGNISLKATDPVRVSYVEITPNVDAKSISIRSYLNNSTNKKVKAKLSYESFLKSSGKGIIPSLQDVVLMPGDTIIEHTYSLGADAKLWDEFNPVVYSLSVKLKSGKFESDYASDFGLREFTRKGNVLVNNHCPVFLRGTLECCIFPQTGHPPMTEEGWLKVFTTAREWGLNHLRFHSWCPPAAAFQVADKMGFYLQVELPVWSLQIGKSSAMTDFLYSEAYRIIREYGNHPSFCMMSLGNELQGDMSVLATMISTLKKKDSRRLYTTTSFTFEKGHGIWPEKEDDYLITQWTKKGWVRGQGVFNSEPPSFDKDYSKSVEGMEVPLITHEIGQYSVYPDLKEIDKYKGVLEPLNFIAIKRDLEKKGLLDKANDYLLSSGKLAALLYKEEIERALKTAGISGFQLLDLHDFPGQGTALVGLLNAFWDSKGIISSQEFRGFCAPVVPLLRFPKAVYTNSESFVADVEISNYSSSLLQNKDLSWIVKDESGNTVATAQIKGLDIKLGHNSQMGKINLPLNDIKTPSKLSVSLSIDGTDYINHWNIWVYPATLSINYGKVHFTRNFAEAKKLLEEGKTVLFNPDWRKLNGIEGKFVPVFWSPVHFPKQAGTMGVLCDGKHPAFHYFPTDNHTDWQWWDLNINSTTLITDSINGGNSIVSMIDNFANNRRLSSVYEGSVGKGKLIITSIDLCTKLDERPVARQLLYSLLQYMNSADFKPLKLTNFEEFGKSLREEKKEQKESAKSIY